MTSTAQTAQNQLNNERLRRHLRKPPSVEDVAKRIEATLAPLARRTGKSKVCILKGIMECFTTFETLSTKQRMALGAKKLKLDVDTWALLFRLAVIDGVTPGEWLANCFKSKCCKSNRLANSHRLRRNKEAQ